MSNVIDLDAKRKAREAEATGEKPVIRLNGEEFTLPRELPIAFAYYLTQMELLKAANVLVGPDRADAFLAASPSDKDLEAIIEAYGVTLGEASASSSSSRSTTKKSKPTSSGSTG